MDTRKQIGGRIRKLRQAAGLTQKQLAEQAGVHFNTLKNIEYGTHYPSLMTVECLAKVLGVPEAFIPGFGSRKK